MTVTIDWQAIELEQAGLSVDSVRFLGEGWGSRAYVVNEDLVFRFPKRAEQWEELDREIRFLAYAADRLPLPVPRYVSVVPESAGAPFGYGVYPYLPGDPLDPNALSPGKRAATAERLAGFLRALHGLRPGSEIDALLPRDDERTAVPQLLERARRTILPQLAPAEAVLLEARIDACLGTPEIFDFEARVIHADFSVDHILVRNGSVSAVLDFEDVNQGDPDYDFMYLFMEAGEPFVEQVVGHYRHPDPARLRGKLEHYVLIESIDTIVNGEGYALAGQCETAWRRLRSMLLNDES